MSERAILRRDDLPLTMPEPCPICGERVWLTGVTAGVIDEPTAITEAEFDCDTQPDIDGDDWPDWHAWHYHMPYADWLLWECRMLKWFNRRYRYQWEPPATGE